MRVRSNGSKTSSTLRPTSTASTSYLLPCSPTVLGLGDGPPLRPQERLAQLRRGRHRRRVDHRPALRRRLPGLGMLAAVIDRLDPRGEQRVQVGHVVEFAARADLDEELVAHGAEESFDLPPTGRLAGPRVDQPDAEHAQARCSCLSIMALPLSR